MQTFLFLVSITYCVDLCFPCALPFWWNEQFHFPPYYPSGQPKTTFKYVETYHQTNPNNFVHVKEYSEYTWWEHDAGNVNVQSYDYPTRDVNVGHDHSGNAFFTKTNGWYPTHRHTAHGVVPQSKTNNIVPRGDKNPFDTNNIVPADKTDRVSPPLDTNGMMPADRGSTSTTKLPFPPFERPSSTTERPSPPTERTSPATERFSPPEDRETTENTAEETTPKTDAPSDEREVNEREESSRIVNFDDNDLEAGSERRPTYKLPDVKEEETFLSGWFGKKKPKENEPCKVSESDINSLRSMIEKMFSFPRELPETKEKAREDIVNKFKELGLMVWTQNFTTPPMKTENGTVEEKDGVNLIGVIPGSQRGHLADEIVLVGAHYDTVANSNGVDDNGSGLAVMLEIAKTIMEARCRLNHTLMFVAFDHEENGAMGSNYFVDHYLIPEELKRARAQFQGAFILDGILNYNDVPNTQELPLDYTQTLPGLQYFVNHTGNRGNFLAMISRNEMDSHLSQKLMNAWEELGTDQYKLFNLAVDMGNEIPPPPVIEKHLNFLRSDHATFWYHNSSSHFPDSLNAVLLTDTGPYRGQMKECYHSKCDDLTVMSPEKLQFAKKTADALTATLVELTRATAAGHQVQPTTLLYFLHAIILFYTLKHFMI